MFLVKFSPKSKLPFQPSILVGVDAKTIEDMKMKTSILSQIQLVAVITLLVQLTAL